ncbi:MAG: peptide/nickel transport system permease protein [Candidatus Poriferisodalaceae bacterium]|jgi:peptide/nickel transport system permease protein
MLRLLATRLATIIPTLLFATFTIFGLQHIGPADPAVVILGENATEERMAEVREELGLNDPLVVQYGKWLGNVATGDLGKSIIREERVATTIRSSLPITLQLVLSAVFISVIIGIPLGMLAATRANKKTDVVVTSGSAIGVSIPSFWLALVLITAFSIRWKIFPARGFATIGDGIGPAFRHTILPAFVLSTSGIAIVTRQVRGAMIEALSADSVRTHKAKGLSSLTILWKHALRNSGVTIITVIGLLVNTTLGATVVIEAVFAIPGMGFRIIGAANARDFPLIQGVVLTYVLIVLAINLLIDIAYRIIDPRIQ